MLVNTPTAWIDRLKEIVQQKSIWIWGAGNQGRGMAQSLIKMDIPLQGFVDNSLEQQQQSVLGKKVLSPDAFFRGDFKACFVIVASFYFEKMIMDICLKHGLAEGAAAFGVCYGNFKAVCFSRVQMKYRTGKIIIGYTILKIPHDFTGPAAELPKHKC